MYVRSAKLWRRAVKVLMAKADVANLESGMRLVCELDANGKV